MNRLGKCGILATGLLFCLAAAQGQSGTNQRVDSLYVVLASAPDQERPKLMLNLLYEIQRFDKDSALSVAQKAIGISDKSDDYEALSGFYDIMGRIWYSKGQHQLAIRMLEKGMEYSQRLDLAEANGHLANSLGMIYLRQKNLNKALQLLEYARNEFNRAEEWFLLAHVHVNLGNLYSQLHQPDKAVALLDEALRFSATYQDAALRAKALNNLGEIYEREGQYEKAEHYYLASVETKERAEMADDLFSTYLNLSRLHLARKQIIESKRYLDLAYVNADKDPRRVAMIPTLLAYGKYEEEIGNAEDAYYYYQAGLKLSDSLLDFIHRIEFNRRLAQAAQKTGRLTEALAYQIVAFDLLEAENERIKGLHRNEIEGLNLFNSREINLARDREERARMRIQLLATSGGLLLAVLLFLALLSRYCAKIRSERILESQNAEIHAAHTLLEQRTAEIEDKNVQLERSNKELSEFAYAASHDLREPLRTIKSYLQLLVKRSGASLEGDSLEFVQYAMDASSRLEHLLNSLLQYSRVGRGEGGGAMVSLREVMETVQMDLRKVVQEKNASITYEQLPTVWGYPTELYQLFLNLISNSLKFTRPNIPAQIHISATVSNGWNLIAVRDNGIGIEPRNFNRIFTMFQRLNAPGAYEGGGIGLATCKKIAEHHKGEIWVESGEGTGSVFYVKLPMWEGLPAD